MASDKTIKVFDQLQAEGVGGLHYYRGFKMFLEYKPKDSERYQVIICQFLRSTTSAYLAMTLLALSNLLKNDNQAVCINYLLNLFRRERLFLDQIETDEAFLAGLREEAGPLLAMRSKIFAHVDRAHITNPSLIEEIMSEVNFGDIESLYQRIRSILNTYGNLLGRGSMDWELPTWIPELQELFIMLDLGFISRQERKAAGKFDAYES